MRYRLFGKSGLRVSELCLGTMTFGEDWGWGATKQDSRKIFDTYVDAGGNFIDTANNYTEGTAEKFVGEFVGERRHQFVLGTKYSMSLDALDPNSGGNHRKSLVRALEGSLRRLKTDYVDLYWVHGWDPMTPIEETMRALDDVVRAGKVLYVGIADVPAWVVAKANMLADFKGWSPFVGVQMNYNLGERSIERDFFQLAREFDLAIGAWGPLGRGLLSVLEKTEDTNEHDRLNSGTLAETLDAERKNRIVEEVRAISRECEKPPAHVILNWVRQHKTNPVVIPILGGRVVEQFKNNLGALDFDLSKAHLERLDEVSRFDCGQSHLEHSSGFMNGEFDEKIDSHR